MVEIKTKMSDERDSDTRIGDQRLDKIYDTAVPAGKRLIDSVRGTEPIGMGGEKTVYNHKDGKVVAFLPPSERPSPVYIERLKHFYYATKLAHILLPDNIPNAYLVGSQPPMMVFDKVKGECRTNQHEEIIELQDKAKQFGIHLDSNFTNYLVDEYGNLQFVDSVQIIDWGKLYKAVLELPDDSRSMAERYYRRLDSNITGAYISH